MIINKIANRFNYLSKLTKRQLFKPKDNNRQIPKRYLCKKINGSSYAFY